MKFRVLSYNIHRAIGLDRRFQPARIMQVLREHDPDIVLLQEVDKGVPRCREMDMAEELADLLDYPHVAAGYNVKLRKGVYGNATLSRYPIAASANIDLKIADNKNRGCLHTEIHVPRPSHKSVRLDVFNLHLGLSPLERQRQAGILLKHPQFTEIDLDMPCIVGGDFNDWLSRLRALFVEGASLKCATDQETHFRTRPLKTYPSISPRGGLDRIYYRGDIRLKGSFKCRLKVSRVASDHLPVIADFLLI